MDYPLLRFGPAIELPPRGRLETLRAALERRLVASVPGPEGQLAAGLLLGRDAALGPELRTQLQVTGTSHILAPASFSSRKSVRASSRITSIWSEICAMKGKNSARLRPFL